MINVQIFLNKTVEYIFDYKNFLPFHIKDVIDFKRNARDVLEKQMIKDIYNLRIQIL